MASIQNTLDSLARAVSSGKIIDSDFKVIEKHGWTWRVLKLVKCILQPIYTLLGKDSFQHYRIDAIAKSLLKLCQNHTSDLTPQLKAKVITAILSPLENKTKGKYSKDIEVIKTSILALGSISGDVISRRKILVQNAIQQFAHQLHLKLAQNSPYSICFSPISLILVLGMILKGMPEDRKQLFLHNIGLEDLPEPMIHVAMMEILNDLSHANGNFCSIRYANAMAVPKMGGIYQEYKDSIANTYKAEIFPIAANAGQACKTINAWISQKTNGHIQNLINPQDLQADLPNAPLFALLNALYFQGQWEKKFLEAVDEIFTFANGGSVQVKMMSLRKCMLACYEGNNFRMLEIPYKSPQGHNLAHLVFLPNPGENLAALESRLTPAFVAQCRSEAHREEYNVKMPKINADVKFDQLLPILTEMGLPLRGKLPHLGNEAEIFKIIHKAKVKVDEIGTIAAASTAAIGYCTSAPPNLQAPKMFYIDRDYAYFIVDKDTILFQGNVKDPQALVR